MKDKDYVAYIDTDSLFLMISAFLIDKGVTKEHWTSLTQEVRTKYILKISKLVEGNVNDRSYNETQLNDYNSILDRGDFSISFKQEIVCPKALFIAPKMYCYYVINDEGFDCDRIDAKGIEIVRSNAPRVFRKSLKYLIETILKDGDEDVLKDTISDHKKGFYSAIPEDISTNIGVNNLLKYTKADFSYIKGTPYQVKGAANYHWLLDHLGITHQYEPIKEGDKVKLVYVKENRFGIKNIAYYNWPSEFTKAGLVPDVDIMIEKYYTAKAKILFEPMDKVGLLFDNSTMDEFF